MPDNFLAAGAGQVQIGDQSVNRIGLGTNRITDTTQARELLEYTKTLGINFIDTAHIYSGGASETTIGNTLAPYQDDLLVATKGGMAGGMAGNNSEEFMRANLETSLRRLQTDSITLYQIHRLDPGIPIEQTMGLMKTFQQEGKIKHVGLSEVTVEQLAEACKYVPIASVQNQYSLTHHEQDPVLDYCTENNIVFIPYFPLRDVNEAQRKTLRTIASKYDATGQQVALAWLLKRSPITLPIPGTLSKQHLKDNVAAANIKLSNEDYETLLAYS